MELLFWITTLICFFQGVYKVIYRKDYFNIYTFVFVGIYFPMVLYLLNWSSLIVKEVSPIFYLMFSSLNIFIIFTNQISEKTLNDNAIIVKVKRDKRAIFIGNIIYFAMVALENYFGSGYILPALHKVDIHTYSMPVISYFTNCLFVVVLANFLYWYATKKKRYLIWMLFFILLPIIGKSSRMNALISCVQLFSFGMFLYINDKRLGKRIKKQIFEKRWQKNLMIIAVISMLLLMVKYTDYRMNDYGRNQLKYEDTIGYTGPEKFKNIISVYYGYFALSFNNLNVNIKYKEISPNYVGLYSYKCIYFGTFRLHNIFGLNPYQPEQDNYYSSTSATVPTGFLDFYYDYGLLFFIPILVGIIIYSVLKRKVLNITSSGGIYAIYFYWVPLWFFMSFQNTIYGSLVLSTVIILYFYINYLFKIEHVNI